VNDLARKLAEVDQHCIHVVVLSLCVVPDIRTSKSISVLVDQNVSTDTCSRTFKSRGVYAESAERDQQYFAPEMKDYTDCMHPRNEMRWITKFCDLYLSSRIHYQKFLVTEWVTS